MNISVLTPDRKVFEGDISSITVPGSNGQLQVLKNHAPLVSSLGKGEVRFVKSDDGRKQSFSITSGFVEVLNNEISLLVQGYNAVEMDNEKK
jgi:F-type H+-transporting ATPase subunit epsilon